MVTARAWTLNAVVRFILSLLVFLFCGFLLLGVLHHNKAGPEEDLRFYRLTASALGCTAIALVFVYRPWNAENVVIRLVGYLMFFYGGVLFGAWAEKKAEPTGLSVSQMVIASLSFQGAALALIPHFLKEQGLSWHDAFGFGNNRRQAFVLGVILACLFLPVGIALQWLSAQLMVHIPHFNLRPQEQESVQTLEIAVTWFNRIALGVVTIVLAPAAEEMLFRGILYNAIKQAGFPRLALWGTVLLFAGIHMNMVTFIPLAMLALALTQLYERTDNLWGPITAHATFNALNYIILYLTQGPLSRLR